VGQCISRSCRCLAPLPTAAQPICLSSVACVYILTRCPLLTTGHRWCMLARRCKRATRSRSATATSVTWRCFLCLSSDECWRVCLGAPPRHVAFPPLCCVALTCVRGGTLCVCTMRLARTRTYVCEQLHVHYGFSVADNQRCTPAFPLPLPACCLPVCSCCVNALPLALPPPPPFTMLRRLQGA
jgi:hypothetical protein